MATYSKHKKMKAGLSLGPHFCLTAADFVYRANGACIFCWFNPDPHPNSSFPPSGPSPVHPSDPGDLFTRPAPPLLGLGHRLQSPCSTQPEFGSICCELRTCLLGGNAPPGWFVVRRERRPQRARLSGLDSSCCPSCPVTFSKFLHLSVPVFPPPKWGL